MSKTTYITLVPDGSERLRIETYESGKAIIEIEIKNGKAWCNLSDEQRKELMDALNVIDLQYIADK
jgi:hypothetical protein